MNGGVAYRNLFESGSSKKTVTNHSLTVHIWLSQYYTVPEEDEDNTDKEVAVTNLKPVRRPTASLTFPGLRPKLPTVPAPVPVPVPVLATHHPTPSHSNWQVRYIKRP
jgi:hypothetical protein